MEDRKHSLLFWQWAIGRPVTMYLYGRTTVSGVLSAVNSDQQEFIIQQLQTPVGTYKMAVVRKCDLLHLDVH